MIWGAELAAQAAYAYLAPASTWRRYVRAEWGMSVIRLAAHADAMAYWWTWTLTEPVRDAWLLSVCLERIGPRLSWLLAAGAALIGQWATIWLYWWPDARGAAMLARLVLVATCFLALAVRRECSILLAYVLIQLARAVAVLRDPRAAWVATVSDWAMAALVALFAVGAMKKRVALLSARGPFCSTCPAEKREGRTP